MFNFGTEPLITQAYFEATTGLLEANMEASDKATCEAFVQGITAQVRSFCSTHLSQATYQEVWDSQGSDVLIPSECPISSVVSLKIAADGKFSNVEPLAASDYAIHPSKQYLSLRYMRFPRGRGMIQVEYVAGYADIPKDIQLAIALQYNFMQKMKDTPAIKTITKLQETMTYDDKVSEYGMAPVAYNLLMPYKRVEAPLSVMFSRVS
jgi:hypothetical protein